MSKLIINGGKRLRGKAEVQGAKNSVLPILAASVIVKGESVIHNCPNLSDVDASVKILRYLGCGVTRCDKTLIVDGGSPIHSGVPDELMRKTRSSIVFLGAVLARTGRAKLSFPGGCEIGVRPIDLHLNALRRLGAHINERHGCLECTASGGLRGAKITLSFPSVGATEHIMIAACLAKGTTTVINAAREPEVVDLADYLNACGAKISGAGEGVIEIDGVRSLSGAVHTVIPDRIVAATLMSCAAATGSEITLGGVVNSHLSSVVTALEGAGCKFTGEVGSVTIQAPERLGSMKTVITMPFPGFPTDAQAPLLAAACTARGSTVFVENIFENRYRHIPELVRMGADIKSEGRVAVVQGVNTLYGASVESTDLRGGASLVVAGLGAEGTTEISGTRYIERGYDEFEAVLSRLGADIKKI